jgi:hypothetical protein
MRTVLRHVAALLAISLLGSLPVRGDVCEAGTAPCRDARPQPMNCCSPTHCRCDLSMPVQPAPNPASTRATMGREIVKVASLSTDTLFFAGGEYSNARSTAKADTSPRSTANSYLLTHAFLI